MASEDDTLVADTRDTQTPAASRVGMPIEALTRGAGIGRYVALDELGRGAMGVVYLAYDPDLDRRVALKLLQREGPDANARLLREARAMARLSHPNVVAVHDVGEHDGLIYVAMDMVEGGTLRQWRDAVDRTVEEILTVFRDAGAGLAAAHDAGLVHRDFKPDNVLLTRQGRAMVTDFGLARAKADEETTQAMAAAASTSGGDVGATLTATGTLSGTPAYMSPEQFSHQAVDHLSDQFSFCITLYEVLFGERPFSAKSLPELSAKVLSGELTAPSSASRVPAWLRAVVERGLQVDPAARYPSMHALLADLAPKTARRGRSAWVLGGAVLAVGLVAAATRTEAGPTCDGAAARLAGHWDDERSTRIGEAFAATKIAYAPATFERVQTELDTWADAWGDARRDTCEATHVRGEQSAARMDLRIACLDRQLHVVDAIADELETPDETLVDRAYNAVRNLPDPAACEDPGAAPELSADDAERVEAARAQLAVANARNELGRHGPGIEAADAAVEALGEVASPIRTEILTTRGQLLHRHGQADDAIASLEAALESHATTPAAHSAAEAWLLLLMVVSDAKADADRAVTLLLPARLAVEAADADDLRRRYHSVAGTILMNAGQVEAGVAELETALAQAHEMELSHATLDVLQGNYGNALYQAGRYEDALVAYTASLEHARQAYGTSHPSIATSEANLGRAYVAQGDYAQAKELYARSLQMRIELLGPQHHGTGASHLNLGDAIKRLGDEETARVHTQRALEIWTKALDPDHPYIAAAHNNLGALANDSGDDDAALQHYRAADEIAQRREGDNGLGRATSLGNVGNILHGNGDYTEALETFDLALQIRRKHLGDDHPTLGFPLLGKARAQLELGDHEAAVTSARWALRVREGKLKEPAPMYLTYIALAEALARTGALDEARGYAEQAREQFAQSRYEPEDAKELIAFDAAYGEGK